MFLKLHETPRPRHDTDQLSESMSYWFTLNGRNRKVVMTSETYYSRANAVRAARRVLKGMRSGKINLAETYPAKNDK